ncbi:MAG TPA: hypothetical protein VHD32_05615 [Candidatus Didemnitutus sp.]|nr:hypothetical protein [Candidatus Didemnitutus sp.]
MTVSSRKSFLAKLAGLIGVAGVAPQMLLGAKRTSAAPEVPKIVVKTDPRTISRQEESA